METKRYRLASMPAAQCYVAITFDSKVRKVELWSYSTLVITLNLSNFIDSRAICTGTYSMTTARHINRFTTEFIGRNMYHEMKKSIGSKIDLELDEMYNAIDQAESYLYEGNSKPFFGSY